MTGIVRESKSDDMTGIRAVLVSAFPTAAEADLRDALTLSGARRLELVFEENGRIQGHILFTPMSLDIDGGPLKRSFPLTAGDLNA